MKDREHTECGLCGGWAPSNAITFRYAVPESERTKYHQAQRVELNLALCPECGAKLFKHLKRGIGMSPFRLVGRGEPPVRTPRRSEIL